MSAKFSIYHANLLTYRIFCILMITLPCCIFHCILLVRTVNNCKLHFPAPLLLAQNPDLGLLAAMIFEKLLRLRG